MSNVSKKLLMAAGGAAGGDPVTIDQVFSTTVYTGNGTNNHEIVTGIDMTEGALVWSKDRNQAYNHTLVDSAFGTPNDKYLSSNLTGAYDGPVINSFTTTGYKLHSNYYSNESTRNYVSWSFRKAPKFFDVVTYTGNGGAQVLNHSLGSTVGLVIIKRTDNASDWTVGHRLVYQSSQLKLNSTAAGTTNATFGATWSDTTIQVEYNGDQYTDVNRSGGTYIAYIFADNSSEDAADRLISCGSYTGNGSSTGPVVDLGFEPQFLITKPASSTGNWYMYDTMRGLTGSGANDAELYPSSSGAEYAGRESINITSTGFQLATTNTENNANNVTYIYMAIRRDNQAEVTDATKVYTSFSYSGNNTDRIIGSSSQNPTDMVITQPLNIGFDNTISARLTGNTKYQRVSGAAAEETFSNGVKYDQQYGQKIIGNELTLNRTSYTYQSHHLSRAKGFFDCCLHTGTGSAQLIVHQLSVVPEMIWVRNRSAADAWAVYFGDNTDYLILSSTAATADDATFWNDTSPTSSAFTVGTNHSVNASGENYISYLFSSLANVSKVGTVTHSGSSTDVACGFSAGARFVMLKRTDASGDWIIWNSVTGIVSGNDPYKILNDTGVQVTNTDFIDPLSSGFTITGDFTDGDYLFYAIA